MPLTSRKHPLDMRSILIQGDSVRMTWGIEEETRRERKPLRRDPPTRTEPSGLTEDILRVRLGEELDYVRRMLDQMGDRLSADPILIRRHAMALQSLDIVGQVLGHVGNVIRSSDPYATIERIGMVDLKARLSRRKAL